MIVSATSVLKTESSAPVYAKSESTIVAEVDGQMVALDVSRGICFGLNQVATRIWNLLDGSTSVDAIIDSLLEVYDVDPAVCREETFDLFAQLEAKHLVTPL